MPRQTIALLDQRLKQLEKNSEKIDSRLTKIMTNHLPHIEVELIAVKTKMNVLSALNIGAVIILGIMQRFL